ncbi:maleylpyruvate isomerase N-terminal domain-containing protein [Nonomuraea sp. ATR24]|uniref:maleylpyruvate isomerase N-terminal domain-containing protein n=1 Tax=Nonomuraea sp. ATR24 TaxID=1676744 RepID=UPI0035BEBEE7
MAQPQTPTVPTPSTAALLDRAIAYTTGSLHLVTPAALHRPTPCAAWTLADLLAHMNDSFQTLYEAATHGHIPPPARDAPTPETVAPRPAVPLARDAPTAVPYGIPAPVPPPSAPECPFPQNVQTEAGELRGAACATLGAWSGAVRSAVVSVGGLPLAAELVAGVGAVEITVHGWDVAQACGHPRPIPATLAGELLELAALFVTPADRPARFAPPRSVPSNAPAEARLLACLGRDPNAS